MGKIRAIQFYDFFDGEYTYFVEENIKENSFCISKGGYFFSEKQATEFVDRYFDLLVSRAAIRQGDNSSDFYDCVSMLDKSKDQLIIKAHKDIPTVKGKVFK